jgi:hypothetical protein
MQYDIIETHITCISVGDTVFHCGELKTVSGNNIKRCPLMGKSLFGDSYRMGTKPVKRVINLRG